MRVHVSQGINESPQTSEASAPRAHPQALSCQPTRRNAHVVASVAAVTKQQFVHSAGSGAGAMHYWARGNARVPLPNHQESLTLNHRSSATAERGQRISQHDHSREAARAGAPSASERISIHTNDTSIGTRTSRGERRHGNAPLVEGADTTARVGAELGLPMDAAQTVLSTTPNNRSRAVASTACQLATTT